MTDHMYACMLFTCMRSQLLSKGKAPLPSTGRDFSLKSTEKEPLEP